MVFENGADCLGHEFHRPPEQFPPVHGRDVHGSVQLPVIDEWLADETETLHHDQIEQVAVGVETRTEVSRVRCGSPPHHDRPRPVTKQHRPSPAGSGPLPLILSRGPSARPRTISHE